MMGKNTTVTRQDIIVVLDLLKESVMEQILMGFPINTDLFKANVSIKGGFASPGDEFDPARHQVNVNLNASPEFKKEVVKEASPEVAKRNVSIPAVSEIFDFSQNAGSTELSLGRLIEVRGRDFTVDDLDTIVFLSQDGSEEMIFIPELHKVTERRILLNLPVDLTAGEYWLSVMHGNDLKAPRGTYASKLTIT